MTERGATRPELVELLRRLIICDTSNPPGHEARAAAIVEDVLAAAGVAYERVAKDPARPNLVARIPGRGDGPSLAFLGHLDVTPAIDDGWTVDPFAGIERDGAIWGRGTVDMKCQVAATTAAFATLARHDSPPEGDLWLLLVADEEVGEAGVGVDHLLEERPQLRPDFVVGEGAGERYATTRGPLYLLDCGVKATASVELEVRGRPADSSLPDNGANAVYELARLLGRLEAYDPPARIHPALDDFFAFLAPGVVDDASRIAEARAAHPAFDRLVRALVTNVVPATTIETPGPANAVAGTARANLQCAVLPGVSKQALEDEIRAALGPGGYTLKASEPEGGLVSPTGTMLHRAIERFVEEHDGEARLVPTLGYGYSDCHTFREKCGSVAYGFIPFRYADPLVNLTSKHGVDERILVDDLVFQYEAALFLAQAVSAAGV